MRFTAAMVLLLLQMLLLCFMRKLENDWTLIVLRWVLCSRNVDAMGEIEHAEEIYVWNTAERCSMANWCFQYTISTTQYSLFIWLNWLATIHFECFSLRSHSIAFVAHQLRIWFQVIFDFRPAEKKNRISCVSSAIHVSRTRFRFAILVLSRSAAHSFAHLRATANEVQPDFPFTDYFVCM